MTVVKAMTETEQQLHARLNAEAAKIPWRELQRHYARGAIMLLDADQDLIASAVQLACDDQASAERWSDQGGLRRANDEDARDWLQRDAMLWAVVVAPWVLVQEQACSISG